MWVVGYSELGEMLWNKRVDDFTQARDMMDHLEGTVHHMTVALVDPNQHGIWGGKEPWSNE